jgi:FtsP/CotA-like multicopper oxidase with cupredoxin domain
VKLQLLPQLRRIDWIKASLAFIFLGLASRTVAGCGGSSSGAGASPAPAPFTFPQPQVYESSGGALKTTLHARIGDNTLADQFSGDQRLVHTPTFDGTIPGPTLLVKPGDTLSIDMANDLPANPTVQRANFFPHDPYTINLHTHGLEVSPLGISDNIFRQMPPGTNNQIQVDIPASHPSGTFWYHTHKHGSVTFNLLGGMAGFLIVKGGRGTLDALPEVAAARDVMMAFQEIRTDLNGDTVFVNQQATQFGTFPFGTEDPTLQGVWSTYGLDGAPGLSNFYFTTNGVTNPTLQMQPGEVQRWRLLNASEGENLLLTLEGTGLNVVAMDGITASKTFLLAPGTPLVIGPGQRYDVLVQAGQPGTYRLLAQDPGTSASVSPSGIAPEARTSRHSFDFPEPCGIFTQPCDSSTMLAYPFPLVTVMVSGHPKNMKLPTGPLPVPKGLPSVADMLNTTPNVTRHVAFELCGQMTTMSDPTKQLPSCGWYFAKYDATYWGGEPFNSLLMVRDDDDKGVPNPVCAMAPTSKECLTMPLINFQKDGLFNPDQPLFDDMIANKYEEWTVINRSFSDHPFHLHQNPFLLTKINGQALATPEWHDTIIVPGVVAQAGQFPPNINDQTFGSITFRVHFNPITVGCFVAHCHTISHEDLGMMQRLDILPGPNQASGCVPETITQSKPVSTPKKTAKHAIRRKIAESGGEVSVAELDTASRNPRLWRTTSLISWPVPTHDRFRSFNGGR